MEMVKKLLRKWRLFGELHHLRQRVESLDRSIFFWMRTMETHSEARGLMWAGILDSLREDRADFLKQYEAKQAEITSL